MRNEPTKRAGHRVLPHTADVILEAWAPTCEECIAEAVAALVDSFLDVSQARPAGTHSFSASVTTCQAALVTVLEEVLYILDMRGQVPVTTTVAECGSGRVSGSFTLVDVTDRALDGSTPKGISLSGLVFHETDGRWSCTCTVDV